MSGRNIAAVVVVAVVVLIALIWLLSSGGMLGWGTGSGMMGRFGYGSSGSGIVTFFVGAALVCGIVCLGALLPRPSRATATIPVVGSARPLDILKERFARGELTREEYDQMRKELER